MTEERQDCHSRALRMQEQTLGRKESDSKEAGAKEEQGHQHI